MCVCEDDIVLVVGGCSSIARHHFSILRPSVKQHVENMISRFQNAFPHESSTTELSALRDHTMRHDSTSNFLLLSSTDVLTLLDALFPQICSPVHTSPASAGVASWSSHIPSPHTLRPEPPLEPGFFRPNPELSPRPISQSGSIFSVDSLHISGSEFGIVQTAARIRFQTVLKSALTEGKLNFNREGAYLGGIGKWITIIEEEIQQAGYSVVPPKPCGRYYCATDRLCRDCEMSGYIVRMNK